VLWASVRVNPPAGDPGHEHPGAGASRHPGSQQDQQRQGRASGRIRQRELPQRRSQQVIQAGPPRGTDHHRRPRP
jgi:hypothetical protein